MTKIAVLHTGSTFPTPVALPKVDANQNRLLAAYDRLIDNGKIDQYTKLIPLADLTEMAQEITQASLPCGKDFAARWVAYLVACFPSQRGGESKIYIRSVIHDLAEFPADIVEKTFHAITRSSKFLPSRSEVLAEAQAIAGERRAMMSVIKGQIEEHERRKAAAQQDQARTRWADLPDAEKQALQAKIDAVKAMASTKAGEKFATAVGAGRPLTEDTPSEELTEGLSPDQIKAYWLARLAEKTPSQARALARGDKAQ